MLFHQCHAIFRNVGGWVVLVMLVSGCTPPQWTVPPDLAGYWLAGPHPVAVRTEPKWMKFEFTKDTVWYTLNIKEDKTASGTIGQAVFRDVPVRMNGGNPKVTGIAWIVKCGEVEKLFSHDPYPGKEVEIWLSPTEDTTMEGELRFTSGGAHFPMGGMIFHKVDAMPEP